MITVNSHTLHTEPQGSISRYIASIYARMIGSYIETDSPFYQSLIGFIFTKVQLGGEFDGKKSFMMPPYELSFSNKGSVTTLELRKASSKKSKNICFSCSFINKDSYQDASFLNLNNEVVTMLNMALKKRKIDGFLKQIGTVFPISNDSISSVKSTFQDIPASIGDVKVGLN